jgi:hypothetical protein
MTVAYGKLILDADYTVTETTNDVYITPASSLPELKDMISFLLSKCN